MVILVTGGTGLVGRYLQTIMPDAIYISSLNFDLTNEYQVDNMLSFYKPDVVIHLAAKVGGILDNIKYPVEYLEKNIIMNTLLLKKCHKYNIERVISILSTCIYPDVAKTYPMPESELFSGPPAATNFSYGFAKRCLAVQTDSYVKEYNKKWCYLIPCNLYGKYDNYADHSSHFVAALIKKIYYATDMIKMWGTGQPLRQFMYAKDLARIIKYMVDNNIIDNFNVASPELYTIDEIIKIGLKACNKPNLKILYDKTKPDGQFRKDADISKLISALHDFTFTTLFDGIKQTYDFFSKQYNR